MSKIEEFKIYKTKNFGNVKVLKKTSATYKPQPGRVRVKILDKNVMDFISKEEFIFPAIKSTLSPAERKKRSRELKKEAGETEISVIIKTLYVDQIKKLNPDLSFSEIVEKLIKKEIQ